MSEKNKDNKGRWRNATIAFRVSSEEYEEINNRARLCGFQKKQEYILQCVLYSKIRAVGNPLMLVSFRKNLLRIETELGRLNKAEEIDKELFMPIRTMLEILEGFEDRGKDRM